MAVDIRVRTTASIAGGPTFSANEVLELDAYDVVEVTIPAASQRGVEVQPDDGQQLRLLMVTASSFDPALSYRVNDQAEADARSLDQPLLLAGTATASLLGAAPSTLTFGNTGAEDVDVRILVGRLAVNGGGNP